MSTEHKFKVGDLVRRTSGSFEGMRIGDTATVAGFREFAGGLLLKGYGSSRNIGHDPDNLELVESTPARADRAHPVKTTWSDGIEVNHDDNSLTINGTTKSKVEWEEEVRTIRRALGRVK